MQKKKLKLGELDIAPIPAKDMSMVLGGFSASPDGGTSSSGDTVSVSTVNGVDVDSTVTDVDDDGKD